MRFIDFLEQRIPVKVRFLFTVFLINFLIFGIFRLAFLFYFKPDSQGLFTKNIAKALEIGFRFDARLSAWIIIPVLFLSWIPFLNFQKTSFSKNFWTFYFSIVVGIIIFLYCVDFGVYSYVQSRLNATIINEITNLDISLKMVIQSYPVAIVIPAIVFFSILYLKFIKNSLFTIERKFKSQKIFTFLSYSFFLIFTLIALYGRISQFPLRWSNAYFTTDNFINSLALNPILYCYSTLSNNPVDYKIEEVQRYYPLIAELYNVKPDFENLTLRRYCKSNPKVNGRPNIVFIILETFAGFKVGALGNKLNPSPNFDRLAENGVLFTRFYTPMENTSRSIFSWLTGIPDVTEKRYASWHPELVDQHTIINYFEGYKKLFFIGGSASWGNIRGALSSNIYGLEIFEEGFWRSPRLDVWGISDIDLFMEANEVLRETKEPFFAIILTSGNHRPFKIPKNSRG
ncbi:MAG: LTA synthase family protein, partial [Candidatus Aminicenantia bacterium]